MGLQGRYLWCARSGRYCGGKTLVLLQTASVRRNEKIARHYGGKARRTSPTSLTCRHLQCRSDSEVTSRSPKQKKRPVRTDRLQTKKWYAHGTRQGGEAAAEPAGSSGWQPHKKVRVKADLSAFIAKRQILSMFFSLKFISKMKNRVRSSSGLLSVACRTIKKATSEN